MAAAFPSGSNTYVLSLDATNGMVVNFSRNVKDFPLNRYTQIVPVKKNQGYYMSITVEEAGRILSTDLLELGWADGNRSSEFNDGAESFEWLPYLTKRYCSGFNLGELAVSQADWDIVGQHTLIHGQKMMTARTQLVTTSFQTSGNYDSTHTSAVSSITGVTGKWDVSTTARKDIQRSIEHAVEIILKDTLSAVKEGDLHLVIGKSAARKIGVSQEIVDYVKASPDALAQIRGELPGGYSSYGLPSKLYGVNVVVEDSVKVTNTKGATRATSYIHDETKPFICSRPGALEGKEGPNFSTVVLFMKEEMTIETRHDPDHRRTIGRITEDYGAKMVAPVSGFLFTSAVA